MSRSIDYAKLLATVQIDPKAAVGAKKIADRIILDLHRYQEVERLTGVPWWFVAGLHELECGGDFLQHLANGDPIDKATINQPVGIAAGTWSECAVAAIDLKPYLRKTTSWQNAAKALENAEAYNGWGYRDYRPECLSPYLWSGTSHYKKGKYVSDGKWDANAVSQQIGVVPIWMALGVILGRRSMAKLKITTNTWLKKSPSQAQLLLADDKFWVNADEKFEVEVLPEKANHYHCQVDAPIGGLSDFYVFSNHAGIELGGEDPSVVGQKIVAPKDLSFDRALLEYLKLLSWDLECHEHKTRKGEFWVHFGIEDYSAAGAPIPNDFYQDKFNDRHISAIWIPKIDSWQIVQNCAATTEPGVHYTQNRMNSAGAARIKLDTQYKSWKVGMHGTRARYKALVQCRSIDIFRDDNEDGSRAGDKEYHPDDSYINIHHAWNSTENSIAMNSAGCQVKRFVGDHDQMMEYVADYPSEIYAYGAIDGDKFNRWWKQN